MGSTRTNKVALPKTGQTTSYVDYDDGYYEKGSPVSPRYVLSSGGVYVSDRATGLMWVSQPQFIFPGETIMATDYGFVNDYSDDYEYPKGRIVADNGRTTYWVCKIAHTSDGASVATDLANNPGSWVATPWCIDPSYTIIDPIAMTWANAIANCASLDFGGYTDWRLPNITELLTIANWELDGVKPSATYWPTLKSNYYWCSTTDPGYSVRAYLISFFSADGVVQYGAKTDTHYVLPVRGGF